MPASGKAVALLINAYRHDKIPASLSAPTKQLTRRGPYMTPVARTVRDTRRRAARISRRGDRIFCQGDGISCRLDRKSCRYGKKSVSHGDLYVSHGETTFIAATGIFPALLHNTCGTRHLIFRPAAAFCKKGANFAATPDGRASLPAGVRTEV